jgi:hypothetical protein
VNFVLPFFVTTTAGWLLVDDDGGGKKSLSKLPAFQHRFNNVFRLISDRKNRQ